MIKHSFRNAWTSNFLKDKKSYHEILTWDVFKRWEFNRYPEATASRQMETALEIFYSDQDTGLARKFLERSLAVLQRAEAEKKLDSEPCRERLPFKRAEFVRTKSFVVALYNNQPLEPGQLLQASRDFEEWCKWYKGRHWDSQAHAYSLAAIRLSLLAGDTARARLLLEARKSPKWHQEEYALWRQWVSGRSHLTADWQEFDDYFCRIRDPGYNPDVFLELGQLRLELGVLRHLSMTPGRPSQPAWREILDLISQ